MMATKPTLQRYADHSPTPYDGHCPLEGREDWIVAPVRQTRDSGPLDQSNFAQCLKALGGESRSVEVHRFGHWGPGWYKIILVSPRAKKRLAILEDLARSLEDYPVLDESDLSQREHDEFVESWDSWGRREYERTVLAGLEAAFRDDDDMTPIDMEIWNRSREGDFSPITGMQYCLTGEHIPTPAETFNAKLQDAINKWDNADAEYIDGQWNAWRDSMDWEYQPDGDGVTINVSEFAEATIENILAECE